MDDRKYFIDALRRFKAEPGRFSMFKFVAIPTKTHRFWPIKTEELILEAYKSRWDYGTCFCLAGMVTALYLNDHNHAVLDEDGSVNYSRTMAAALATEDSNYYYSKEFSELWTICNKTDLNWMGLLTKLANAGLITDTELKELAND